VPCSCCQSFDPTKFNFTKAFKREVLFAFEPAARGSASSFEEAGRCSASPSVVLINVSPIDYGHVLLCPRVLDCIPQVTSAVMRS
jgi:GDP-L-galactose phosphorylase